MELPLLPQLRAGHTADRLWQPHTFPESLLTPSFPVVLHSTQTFFALIEQGGLVLFWDLLISPFLRVGKWGQGALATKFQIQNINLPVLNKKAYFFEAAPSGIYITPSISPLSESLVSILLSLESIHQALSRGQDMGPTIFLGDIKVHMGNPSGLGLMPTDTLLHSERLCLWNNTPNASFWPLPPSLSYSFLFHFH